MVSRTSTSFRRIWIRFRRCPEFRLISPDRKTGQENRTVTALSTFPTEESSTESSRKEEEKGIFVGQVRIAIFGLVLDRLAIFVFVLVRTSILVLVRRYIFFFQIKKSIFFFVRLGKRYFCLVGQETCFFVCQIRKQVFLFHNTIFNLL